MYTLSESPATRNEAFDALENVIAQGTFTKDEAIEILVQVLGLDYAEAESAFRGLLASGSIEEV